MSSLTTPMTVGAARARPAKSARYFYSAASALMIVLVFLGFHEFYTHGRAYPGRELAPPIRALLIAHGVAMAAWMLLFLVQPLLAATRNLRLHRIVGSAAGALALVIVLLGWRVGIAAARIAPPEMRLWGMTWQQFVIVPLGSIAIFAAFIGIGIAARRRPDVHRPAMLLGTLAALSAAIGRIDFLTELYVGTVWDRVFGPFFMTLAIGALLLAVRCVLTRSFERWFAAGFAALVLACAGMIQLAHTELWAAISRTLLA
jgi:hypothetical protein